jgi:p-cumate 2,3-dioxygenase ferredoxin reductase component
LQQGAIIIAGAGQAGARAAEALRAAGFGGNITLVGQEAHLPYERPQLSKELLLGTQDEPSFIKPAAAWAEIGVDLVTGTTVVDLDRTARRALLGDGRALACDRLLIATGTNPRRLPDIEAGPLPVHYLRSLEDAAAIKRAMVTGARIAIIGGGVIGLEAAAAGIKCGCSVTVIEAAPGLLTRALPRRVSDFLRERHEAQGVVFRIGVAPVAADADGVTLADGSRVAADFIIIGIGVEPEIGLASRLGLDAAVGIKVDSHGETAIPDVYAAGDVALQFSRWHERWMRIETWANAQDQAANTARNMVGEAQDYAAPPWFWTDQYDINLQVVGDPVTPDPILRGDPAGGRFSLIAQRDGRITGAVTVNTPRDMAALRRLVASMATIPRADLENPATDLRRLISAKS